MFETICTQSRMYLDAHNYVYIIVPVSIWLDKVGVKTYFLLRLYLFLNL